MPTRPSQAEGTKPNGKSSSNAFERHRDYALSKSGSAASRCRAMSPRLCPSDDSILSRVNIHWLGHRPVAASQRDT